MSDSSFDASQKCEILSFLQLFIFTDLSKHSFILLIIISFVIFMIGVYISELNYSCNFPGRRGMGQTVTEIKHSSSSFRWSLK